MQSISTIVFNFQFSTFNYKRKSSCPKTTTSLLFRQRPTLPGGLPPSTISAEELNFRVRNGNGWILFAIITGYLLLDCQLNNAKNLVHLTHFSSFCFLRSSPRPISINQLNVSPHLHLWPINHIVYVGSYLLAQWEILSWGGLHA